MNAYATPVLLEAPRATLLLTVTSTGPGVAATGADAKATLKYHGAIREHQTHRKHLGSIGGLRGGSADTFRFGDSERNPLCFAYLATSTLSRATARCRKL